MRVCVLHDVDVGVQRLHRDLGRVDLRRADAVGRVDDLALEVRQVDDVVVDDPDRADAGGGEVQRGRRAEPAGAEQQDLRVEQLVLALGADLRHEHVAAVALALLGGDLARDVDLVAAVLPQRDSRRSSTRRARSRARRASWRRTPSGCPRRSTGRRAASGRARRPRCATRGSCAGRASRRGGGPGRPPRSRARRRPSRRRCRCRAVELGLDLGGVDLCDLALDLADELRAGGAHLQSPQSWSGFGTSESVAMRYLPTTLPARAWRLARP